MGVLTSKVERACTSENSKILSISHFKLCDMC